MVLDVTAPTRHFVHEWMPNCGEQEIGVGDYYSAVFLFTNASVELLSYFFLLFSFESSLYTLNTSLLSDK